MDKGSKIQLLDLLKQIRDLKQSLQAAGIDDASELILVLRRIVVKGFVNNDINEFLKKEV